MFFHFFLWSPNFPEIFDSLSKKKFRGGNYSRVETIRGNTVCLKIQKLVVEELCCARKYEQWETFMTFK